MTYTPHTEPDIAAMLETIGVASVAELFHDVPEALRFPDMKLPEGRSQLEVAQTLNTLAARNTAASQVPSFLGAGVYHHYSPPIIDYLIQRGEFLTAYTPYQPEVSQGTLQAIFEYQSMICTLTGMDVANASHYDGGTALAEAAMMAYTVGRSKRSTVLLCSAINPEFRQVVHGYTQGMGIRVEEGVCSSASPEAFIGAMNSDTAMVAVAYPNFFGQVQDLREIIDAAHAVGALVCIVADPVALGLLKSPGELGADVVVAEGQALGLPMNFGGPYLGIFATREEHVRKMAGRLVGETVDAEGRRGFVLTLATREQHIRRERATSNICTNQGLMALAAAMYLASMGKQGLRKVAEICYQRSHYAAAEIAKLPGISVDMSRPFVKEFVVTLPKPASEINAALLAQHGIIGGFDLSRLYPERTKQMLLCVTEMNSPAQIDALVAALKEVGS